MRRPVGDAAAAAATAATTAASSCKIVYGVFLCSAGQPGGVETVQQTMDDMMQKRLSSMDGSKRYPHLLPSDGHTRCQAQAATDLGNRDIESWSKLRQNCQLNTSICNASYVC